MNRYLAFLVVSVFLGCYPQNEVVEYSLSDEELINVISDLHLMETAMANVHPSRRDSVQEEAMDRISRVYQKPKSEIEQNVKVLQTDVLKHQEIYEKVIDRLQLYKDSAVIISKNLPEKKSK